MYPVMMSFENKLCAVIGGGRAALRKAENLCADGAVLRVAAPEICARLADMAHEVIYSPYTRELLDGCFAVVAATDDPVLNARIVSDCGDMGTLCMSVNGGGDFSFCASADCGGVTVSAYTGGAFPRLGAIIRDDMQKRYQGCGELAEVLRQYRQRVKGDSKAIRAAADAVRLDMTAEELEKILRSLEGKAVRHDG